MVVHIVLVLLIYFTLLPFLYAVMQAVVLFFLFDVLYFLLAPATLLHNPDC